MKLGAPSKFHECLLPACKHLYEKRGYTDTQVAEALGVTERTINNWKKAYPKFFQSMKNWKLIADDEIELKLRDLCLGYEKQIPQQKALNNFGVVNYTETIYVEPKFEAIRYWLNNRKEEWNDKQQIEIDLSKMPDEQLFGLVKDIINGSKDKAHQD